MQADTPDSSIPPGEAEPIDAEFEPAKPEKSSGAGKAFARLAGLVLLLALAGAIGGASGWFAAGLNRPASETGPSAEIAQLESQLAGMEARLNTAEDRPLTEMVPTEALRTFDSEIRALETRLEAVEARPELSSEVDGTALGSLLAQRDAALRADLDAVRELAEGALRTAQAASEGSASASVDLAPLQAQLDALNERLSATGQQFSDALDVLRRDTAASLDELSPAAMREIGALEQRLDALEARAEQASSDTRTGAEAAERSATRILAFTALREAALTGESFEAERAGLARLWPNAPGLAALQPHARAGTATREDLTADFPAEAIRQASGETRRFFGLFEVRPSDSGPDSALTLTRQAENRLARGDLTGAVEAVGRLEGPAADAAAGWLAQARARLETDAALATLRNALTAERETPGRSTP